MSEAQDIRHEMEARFAETARESRAQREAIAILQQDLSSIAAGQKALSEQLTVIAARLNTPNPFNWWAFIGSGVAIITLVSAALSLFVTPLVEKIDRLTLHVDRVESRVYENSLSTRKLETLHDKD